MKKLFYIYFTLIIVICGCEKQQTPLVDLASIKLDTFIVNNYMRDAKLLYFNEIYDDINHLNRNNPILDTSEITKILKLFQIVYNLDSQESKTVFQTHKIHVFCDISFNSIDLKVDPSLPEIKNLINEQFPTGNQSLDNLLNTYNLDSVKQDLSYPAFTWLTLYTKKEFNMIPIANKFNENPSINLALIVNRCGGDGPTINLKRSSNSAILTFIYAWGDCPAGCGNAKYWEFKIVDGEPVSVKITES
jgi:hypothetical protein